MTPSRRGPVTYRTLRARRSCSFSLLMCATLTGCVFDSHELTDWVAGSKRQSIDVNIDHWQSYAFTDDAGTVTIKVPPEFRTFSNRHLPRPEYDRYSGRELLEAQYDYRSKSIEELNQFTIYAS